MMRRKNLERAVVLGLLLSTSVYGNAWAAFWEEEENDVKINYGLGTTVEQSKVDEIVKPGQNLVIETNSVPVWYQGSLTLTNGDLKIDTTSNSGANAIASGWGKDHKLEIFAKDIYIDAGANGIFTTWGEPENLETGSGHIFIGSETKKVDNLFIRAGGQGVDNKKGSVTIYASGEIDITSMKTSGVDPDQAAINNTADNGTVIVNGETIKLTAVGGSGIINDGRIYKKFFGYVYPSDHVNSTTTLDSKNLIIDASAYGIRNNVGTTNINTLESNVIKANIQSVVDKNTGEYIGVFGNNSAIHALDGGTVNLLAGKENLLYGSIYANGNSTTVYSKGIDSAVISNKVYSAAVIDGAGDLAGKTTTENGDGTVTTSGMDVVSALYAEEGAQINLSGVNDIQTYYGDPKDEHTSERAVWAYKGAQITLDGVTNISTYAYEVSPENRDIAIAAGTATKLDEDDFTKDALAKVDMANVNLNYKAGSVIKGDILAAYGGEVRITDANPATMSAARSDAATGINITGDLLAGNTGKLTVDLGNGGSLIGRADDYGDASIEHITLYNPAFSSNIIQGGDVTLNMGDGSEWNVQGQSWITTVNTEGNVKIDLTNVADDYQNYNSHALTIRNLNGDANIKMDLNGDRSQSDMLYIGQGNGEYNIELAELVTVDDMYAQLDDNTKFSGLRFATVGAGSDVKFNVTAKDQGFNNVIYTVDTDVYNSAESKHENNAYNGENMSEEKPGNSLVEDLLNGSQTDSAESGVATLAANDVMLLADEAETVNENEDNHLNYKLVDMKADGLTDAGKTMLNMSRANYSNAIYMDRLNKRLGEARYINDDPEEDEGMWVRIRHDRIGKDDAFRSQNTMYELGYDKRQECDNGKRRVGFAVDYMHGDTGYSDIAGKGEIDRYGLWLYDTWTGNKGHYADYVAKWGHLQNDFEVYTMTGGEKVTGDYSNNVFSISAEYGRKKDMGNDWYIEPQAQLQLARVTGADYTTSQGTKVSVDGINSLIGRAGFRLGKDFGEEKQSTVYFKADVLHEFLGDQTIRAMDGTTDGWQTVDYENKGTWYDIGIGYAAMLSQSTYAFIDLEQSFGNDNDDTYQINAGVRWTF